MTYKQPVTERMNSLVQELEKVSDRRAVFLSCYLLMTQNMVKAVEAGDFIDLNWVRIFLHRFADYYFDALSAYESNNLATPAVWRLAHNAAHDPETLVLQNLLLGINAHINYDLVLTLVDLLKPEWRQLSTSQRDQRHTDYCLVNDIIGYTIDIVQDEVVERFSPVMDLVDKMFGPLDEWLTAHLITNWRDDVWEKAIGLLTAEDAKEYQHLLDEMEATALRRADTILFNIRRST